MGNRFGHCAKDCRLPFVRTFTVAEMRVKRAAEAAQKNAAREAKQAEFEKKRAKWEEEQAVRLAKRLAKNEASAARDWDTKSDISEATTSTAATVTFSNEEVRCLAAKDKEVRKLEK